MKILPQGTVAFEGMRTTYTCPDCQAKLMVRKNHNTQHLFLGCTQYPECRHAEEFAVESENQLQLL